MWLPTTDPLHSRRFKNVEGRPTLLASDLHAAEELAVVAGAGKTVVVLEGAADIEAGPVVYRRRDRSRSLV
jgi:hypothetical protein